MTEPEVPAGTLELPTGNIDLGPEDLFVAHLDGDLWVHPGALGDAPGTPWRLADLEDPRIVDYVSPNPATLEGVAGDVDGVVYYNLSAEDPTASNLFSVVAQNADRLPLQIGLSLTPALSPDRTRLATTTPNSGLVVIDLATGSYEARQLPCGTPQPMMPCLLVDMVWAPDGTSLVFLYYEAGPDNFGLESVDPRAPFETVVMGEFGLVPAPSTGGPFDIHLSGRGPDGEIAVSVGDDTATVIRFFDAVTLAEITGMQRTLPPGVTSVRLADDGVGLLWVDDTTLWYLPDGGDVRDLGSGYTAAWYAI